MHPLRLAVFGRDRSGRPRTAAGRVLGYTPAEIRSYLGLSGDGTGVTVGIVDAFHSPTLHSDVNHFSGRFGLPPACRRHHTSGCFVLRQMTRPHTRTNLGWQVEESLDVEWVHAIAPMATIVVSEARTNSIKSLFTALRRAANAPGVVVIGNSWGGFEGRGETNFDHFCELSSAVCVFASGDFGAPGFYPAYSPDVVAVGGTSLNLGAGGSVVSETAWSCRFDCRGTGGSGGGVSRFEPRPGYQDPVSTATGRGIPDVSFDADVNTGVPVFATLRHHHFWFLVGGTSFSAQAWTAIIAVADQTRTTPLHATGFEAQQAIYGLTLRDITEGTNGVCATCTAGPGYDFVTGLGSPRPGVDAALAAAP